MKKKIKIGLAALAGLAVASLTAGLVVSCSGQALQTTGDPNSSNTSLYTNVYTSSNASKTLANSTNPSKADALLYGKALVSYIGDYGGNNNSNPITVLNDLATNNNKTKIATFPLNNFDYVLTCTNYLSITSLNNNSYSTSFYYYYSFINNVNGNLSYPQLKNTAQNWKNTAYNSASYGNSDFNTLAEALQGGLADYCYANSEANLSNSVTMTDLNPNLITVTSFSWNELNSMLSFNIAYDGAAITSAIIVYIPSFIVLNNINGKYAISVDSTNSGAITGTPGWNN